MQLPKVLCRLPSNHKCSRTSWMQVRILAVRLILYRQTEMLKHTSRTLASNQVIGWSRPPRPLSAGSSPKMLMIASASLILPHPARRAGHFKCVEGTIPPATGCRYSKRVDQARESSSVRRAESSGQIKGFASTTCLSCLGFAQWSNSVSPAARKASRSLRISCCSTER